ncbi:NAD(P)H-dependent flavin oxidoreductase [Rubrobacter indicoceani]|uniref:NAD(P)H-dependent flavin oxidoreductase n=1 Tax=Rubrobacter indicoceani TaxID=2051957 RepID=UPI000E5B4642|nr:nitronate monooxygenase [Rubrobacter indicoceani]
MIRTDLTRLLGLRSPIVCAPMAGWSGGELAGAVSRAGGLGMIGVSGAATAEFIREQSELARKTADGDPFGLGLMTWAVEDRPELLEATLAQRPAAVSLSFGSPAPFAGEVRERGVLLFNQVQNHARAVEAAEAGVDVLVAQGTDAGGHTGSVGTMVLLQEVLEVGAGYGIPVVAAGGIATGRGVAGSLAMGAAGAWVGTRFSATRESLGSGAAKRKLLAARDTDTVHTRVFDLVQGIPWPEEFPGRAIQNDFTEKWHGREDELASDLDAARGRFAGPQREEPPYLYAGQAVGLIDDIPGAGEVLERLVREAEEQLKGVASLFSDEGEEQT